MSLAPKRLLWFCDRFELACEKEVNVFQRLQQCVLSQNVEHITNCTLVRSGRLRITEFRVYNEYVMMYQGNVGILHEFVFRMNCSGWTESIHIKH